MAGADLTRATSAGTRMREAELTGLRAAGATLRGLDLSAAEPAGADLSGADLRGSDLSAVDPRTVALAGAQVDVPQAVVLVTALRSASAPTPRSDHTGAILITDVQCRAPATQPRSAPHAHRDP